MRFNEFIVLVVALTCEALVPMTFLVIFYRGMKGKRGEHHPFALKKTGSATQAILALSSMRN